MERDPERLFGSDILPFRYDALGLSQLDAEEYLDRRGPLGAALSALMNRSGRVGIRSPETLPTAMLANVVDDTVVDAGQIVLVELLLDGRASSVDIDPFDPERFDKGKPIRAEHEYGDD